MNEDKLINLATVLQYVQVSRSKLLNMVQDGTFPSPKPIGRNTLWLMSDVQKFIKQQIKVEK